ncbi:fucose isomerase, partial [Paenibacillus sepulcri]|nr:fucose isomerase [Paenibacillus sepulcri]
NVVRHFRSLRILQIAPRPASFWTMMVNEGELLERFGIEIHPITLVDITRAAQRQEKKNSSEMLEAVDFIRSRIDITEVTDDDVRRVAALKVAMKQFAVETGSSAIAIQC